MFAAASPSMKSSPWVRVLNPLAASSPRVFCFPHSGAGTVMFHGWPQHISPVAEVCAIQLPGRDARMKERPHDNMASLVNALYCDIIPYLDRPFVFFGHSMGAQVAFALTHALVERAGIRPCHLFLSGARAPHLLPLLPKLHTLSDDELVMALHALGGISGQIMAIKELLDLFIPIIRADLAVSESYWLEKPVPLAVPITALGGASDPRVSIESLEAWRDHTTAAFSRELFPGGHFYIQHHGKKLSSFITEALRQTQPITGDSGANQ